jgi:lantibiotic biosynthesis protein
MTRNRGVFEPAGWAMLRAPLLPVTEGDALTRPDVLLALEIASEALADDMERSASPRARPESGRDQARRDRAIRSYLTRMRHRATPFGLCAGVALVRWGEQTGVSAAAGTLSPRARPDMGWVGEVIRMLEGDVRMRRRLRWVANPAVVEHDGRIHLSEQAAGPVPRSGVSVAATPAALAVLDLAGRPTPHQELVVSVLRRPAATVERAEGLVDELCRRSFLLCELWSVVHSAYPLAALLRLLEEGGVTPENEPVAVGLRRHIRGLEALEAVPTVATYRAAVASARFLVPRDGEAGGGRRGRDGVAGRARRGRDAHELQVDGVWELGGATVHRAVAEAAAEAAGLLLRFSPMPYGPGHLAAWRREFVRRYGSNTAVPLPVVLDPALGLGPPVQEGQGAWGPGAGAPGQGAWGRGAWGRGAGVPAQAGRRPGRDALLRRVAIDALRDGRTVVEVDDVLAGGLTTWRPGDSPAPDDADVIVAVAARSAADVDRGEFTCVVSAATGTPGAGKAAGRFAHLLESSMRTVMDKKPGDDRAEVLFRPASDRLLNVALRPDGAGWVIPVGVPAPAARAILPADILVCVDEDRLRLVTRDGRGLTPVATHMLTWSRMPELARFLLDVPRDGRPLLSRFAWGAAGSLPVLPRLQRGRVVLSPARWVCDPAEVTSEKEFARWRDRWAPPAVCYLADGDNRLLIDLDDPADQEEILDRLVRRRHFARLDEALPGPQDAWLPGPDGPRIAELAVPLHRRPAPGAAVPAVAGVAERPRRSWTWPDREASGGAAGTGWLFLKVYVPYDAAEGVLARDVASLVRLVETERLADSWFFIRYHDPALHLRLRWRQRAGAGSALGEAVLGWAYELQRSGLATGFAIDRYEREVARYGGAEAMDIAERVFEADSRLVLGLLELAERRVAGSGGGELFGGDVFADRTELAALTLHRLVADLGVEANDGAAFFKELSGGPGPGRAAGRAYRPRQGRLREVVGGLLSDPEVDGLLAARSAVVTAAAADLARTESGLTQPVSAIRHSLAHMHLNRLLGPSRSYEQLIYGLLERTARSLAASPPSR